MADIICPLCGFSGQIPDQFLGKQVKCRKCASMITVPVQQPPVEAEAKPAAPPGNANLFAFDNSPNTGDQTGRRLSARVKRGLVFAFFVSVVAILVGLRRLLVYGEALFDASFMIVLGGAALVAFLMGMTIAPGRRLTGGTVLIVLLVPLVVVMLLCVGLFSTAPRSTKPYGVSLKGKIEGTMWEDRDGDVGLEFSKKGRFEITQTGRHHLILGLSEWKGRYVLGDGSDVEFYLDNGKKHSVDIFISGDELTLKGIPMNGLDGARVFFRKKDPP